MRRAILICIAIAVVVAVSYIMFNDACSSGAVRLDVKGSTESLKLTKSEINNIVLQRMPYSTDKYQQFETIISVTPAAKQSLHSFTKNNLGKTVSVYFCDKLFADVAVASPTDELRISSMNIEVDQTLKLLKKISKNVEYKK